MLPTPNPFHAGNTETPTEWLARRAEVQERTGTRHGMALSVVALSVGEGAPLVQDGTGPRRVQLDDGQERWGPYAGAVHRWEALTGAPVPDPVEPGPRGPRIAVAFVEWLMGLPAGWVTEATGAWVQEDLFGDVDVATTRAEQFKMLGNGVVPQQAGAAVSGLLGQAPAHVLAALGIRPTG